jgi:hypothetical protein
MERGVRVDEGQVLALQGSVPSRRRVFLEFSRHVGSLCGDASGCVDESPSEGPAEGARLGTIPMSDEAEDVLSERCHALETAVAQDTALKDAEPDLDLIDPGGMQRRVDKAEAMSMLLVEPRPTSVASVVVQVEVVPNDVDTAAIVALCERVHEGQQCTRIAVPNDATEHLPGTDVEGREQRTRPTTTVLEFVANDASVTHVDGVTARQRLHRLLVDAHNDSVLGRVPVEAADARDLRSKIGIRGMEPVANTVRAPATRTQYPSDGTAAHPLAAARVQGVRDRLIGPHIAKGYAVVCRSLTCQLDDLAPGLQRHTRWPAAPRRVKERLHARTSLPAGSPLAHNAIAAPGQHGHPRWTMPVGQPDDHPRADHDVVLTVPPPRERLDARPFESWDAHSSRSRTRIHILSIHEARLLFP